MEKKKNNKKRVSILKKAQPTNSAENSPTFTKINKRISFSGKNSIKQFTSDDDKMTIWGSSYEESAEILQTSNNSDSIIPTESATYNKSEHISLRNRVVVKHPIKVSGPPPKPKANEPEEGSQNVRKYSSNDSSKSLSLSSNTSENESNIAMPSRIFNGTLDLSYAFNYSEFDILKKERMRNSTNQQEGGSGVHDMSIDEIAQTTVNKLPKLSNRHTIFPNQELETTAMSNKENIAVNDNITEKGLCRTIYPNEFVETTILEDIQEATDQCETIHEELDDNLEILTMFDKCKELLDQTQRHKTHRGSLYFHNQDCDITLVDTNHKSAEFTIISGDENTTITQEVKTTDIDKTDESEEYLDAEDGLVLEQHSTSKNAMQISIKNPDEDLTQHDMSFEELTEKQSNILPSRQTTYVNQELDITAVDNKENIAVLDKNNDAKSCRHTIFPNENLEQSQHQVQDQQNFAKSSTSAKSQQSNILTKNRGTIYYQNQELDATIINTKKKETKMPSRCTIYPNENLEFTLINDEQPPIYEINRGTIYHHNQELETTGNKISQSDVISRQTFSNQNFDTDHFVNDNNLKTSLINEIEEIQNMLIDEIDEEYNTRKRLFDRTRFSTKALETTNFQTESKGISTINDKENIAVDGKIYSAKSSRLTIFPNENLDQSLCENQNKQNEKSTQRKHLGTIFYQNSELNAPPSDTNKQRDIDLSYKTQSSSRLTIYPNENLELTLTNDDQSPAHKKNRGTIYNQNQLLDITVNPDFDAEQFMKDSYLKTTLVDEIEQNENIVIDKTDNEQHNNTRKRLFDRTRFSMKDLEMTNIQVQPQDVITINNKENILVDDKMSGTKSSRLTVFPNENLSQFEDQDKQNENFINKSVVDKNQSNVLRKHLGTLFSQNLNLDTTHLDVNKQDDMQLSFKAKLPSRQTIYPNENLEHDIIDDEQRPIQKNNRGTIYYQNQELETTVGEKSKSCFPSRQTIFPNQNLDLTIIDDKNKMKSGQFIDDMELETTPIHKNEQNQNMSIDEIIDEHYHSKTRKRLFDETKFPTMDLEKSNIQVEPKDITTISIEEHIPVNKNDGVKSSRLTIFPNENLEQSRLEDKENETSAIPQQKNRATIFYQNQELDATIPDTQKDEIELSFKPKLRSRSKSDPNENLEHPFVTEINSSSCNQNVVHELPRRTIFLNQNLDFTLIDGGQEIVSNKLINETKGATLMDENEQNYNMSIEEIDAEHYTNNKKGFNRTRFSPKAFEMTNIQVEPTDKFTIPQNVGQSSEIPYNDEHKTNLTENSNHPKSLQQPHLQKKNRGTIFYQDQELDATLLDTNKQDDIEISFKSKLLARRTIYPNENLELTAVNDEHSLEKSKSEVPSRRIIFTDQNLDLTTVADKEKSDFEQIVDSPEIALFDQTKFSTKALEMTNIQIEPTDKLTISGKSIIKQQPHTNKQEDIEMIPSRRTIFPNENLESIIIHEEQPSIHHNNRATIYYHNKEMETTIEENSKSDVPSRRTICPNQNLDFTNLEEMKNNDVHQFVDNAPLGVILVNANEQNDNMSINEVTEHHNKTRKRLFDRTTFSTKDLELTNIQVQPKDITTTKSSRLTIFPNENLEQSQLNDKMNEHFIVPSPIVINPHKNRGIIFFQNQELDSIVLDTEKQYDEHSFRAKLPSRRTIFPNQNLDFTTMDDKNGSDVFNLLSPATCSSQAADDNKLKTTLVNENDHISTISSQNIEELNRIRLMEKSILNDENKTNFKHSKRLSYTKSLLKHFPSLTQSVLDMSIEDRKIQKDETVQTDPKQISLTNDLTEPIKIKRRSIFASNMEEDTTNNGNVLVTTENEKAPDVSMEIENEKYDYVNITMNNSKFSTISKSNSKVNSKFNNSSLKLFGPDSITSLNSTHMLCNLDPNKMMCFSNDDLSRGNNATVSNVKSKTILNPNTPSKIPVLALEKPFQGNVTNENFTDTLNSSILRDYPLHTSPCLPTQSNETEPKQFWEDILNLTNADLNTNKLIEQTSISFKDLSDDIDFLSDTISNDTNLSVRYYYPNNESDSITVLCQAIIDVDKVILRKKKPKRIPVLNFDGCKELLEGPTWREIFERQKLNRLKREKRVSEIPQQEYGPAIPSFQFLYNNKKEEELQALREKNYKEYYIQPFLPLTPSISFLIKNKLAEKPNSWKLNDDFFYNGILFFTHHKVQSIEMKILFDATEKSEYGEFKFQDIITAMSKTKILTSTVELLQHLLFFKKLPQELKYRCPTSDHIFELLDFVESNIIDKNYENIIKLVDLIQQTKTQLLHDDSTGQCFLRKIVINSKKKVIYKMKVNIDDLEKTEIMDIKIEPYAEFTDNLRDLKPGMHLLNEILKNPKYYFKF